MSFTKVKKLTLSLSNSKLTLFCSLVCLLNPFPPPPERSRMDSLRSEFLAVEKRWSKVRAESEEWGRILESLHPEMETFQV